MNSQQSCDSIPLCKLRDCPFVTGSLWDSWTHKHCSRQRETMTGALTTNMYTNYWFSIYINTANLPINIPDTNCFGQDTTKGVQKYIIKINKKK